MGLGEAVVLFIAGLMGGAINAVAGGGSVVIFPTLVFLGVGPLSANATCTASLVPGSLASGWGYRRDVGGASSQLIALTVASLVGGACGALGVIQTPGPWLTRLVPVLIAISALVFTLGEPIRARLAAFGRPPLAVVFVAQLIISLYGGYFGGGMGLLMLALFSLLGGRTLHEMNGLKSVLGVFINGAALLPFVLAGAIDWHRAGVMIVASVSGGYLAATRARAIDPKRVRRLVMVLAWVMSLVLAVKTYLW